MTVHAGTFRIYHLPHDVLCGVPLEGIENSPTFGSPSEGQSILSTVLDATTFMYHAIVDVVTFMADLAESIVTFAIEWIGSISSTVSQGIQRAAEAIVNGFNAFVDWAIDTITTLLDETFSPFVEAVSDAIDAYMGGLGLAISSVLSDLEGGSVSQASRSAFIGALYGDLYDVLFVIGTALYAMAIVIAGMTNLAGFLMGAVVTLAVMYIVEEVVSAEFVGGDRFDIDPSSITADTVRSLALSMGSGPATPEEEQTPDGQVWCTAYTALSAIAGIVSSQASMILMSIEGELGIASVYAFAVGVLGTIIGFSTVFEDAAQYLAGFVALELSMISVGMGAYSMSDSTKGGPALVFSIIAFTSGCCGIISSLKALTLEGQGD